MARPNVGNIYRATGEELEWLRDNKCLNHNHRYTTHFNCFLSDYDIEPVLGCFDIETSNLKANFGIVLSWCIKTVDKDEIVYDHITIEDIDKGLKDSRVMKSLVDVLPNYDRLITHFGTYFDIPFVRTRAIILGLDFPAYGTIYHTDVWKMAKQKLCLHSNRQDCVAEAIQDENIKTRINDQWLEMQFGNVTKRKAAIRYILDHNEKDVIQLEDNFQKLRPFVNLSNTSI